MTRLLEAAVIGLLRATALLAPTQHREWVAAMAAEARYLDRPALIVGFATDCVRAAIVLRLTTSPSSRAMVRLGTLFCGLGFFLHAAVPGSHGWPLIWTIVGGYVPLIVRPAVRGVHAIEAGVRAGLTCALTFGTLSAAWLFWLDVQVAPRLSSLIAAMVAGVLLSALSTVLTSYCHARRR